jgi:ribosomal protein L29
MSGRAKELEELRAKEPRFLLSDLEKERLEMARQRIAVRLGKFSKVHEIKARQGRIARILTVLSEKLRPALPSSERQGRK